MFRGYLSKLFLYGKVWLWRFNGGEALARICPFPERIKSTTTPADATFCLFCGLLKTVRSCLPFIFSPHPFLTPSLYNIKHQPSSPTPLPQPHYPSRPVPFNCPLLWCLRTTLHYPGNYSPHLACWQQSSDVIVQEGRRYIMISRRHYQRYVLQLGNYIQQKLGQTSFKHVERGGQKSFRERLKKITPPLR